MRATNDSRLGKFLLPEDMIKHSQDAAMRIMGRCVILRCEMLYYLSSFEYVAVSPDFDVLKEGELIPTYTASIYNRGNVVFERLHTT